MKTITLRVGDKLRVIKNRPFNAPLPIGEIVTIVSFNDGNDHYPYQRGVCPLVQTTFGHQWYTNLKKLFKNYKKESK